MNINPIRKDNSLDEDFTVQMIRLRSDEFVCG